MPKTVEVLTCSECRFEGYCWRDKPYDDEDPRDDIYEEDIPNYFCASARPIEDAAEKAARLMKEEAIHDRGD